MTECKNNGKIKTASHWKNEKQYENDTGEQRQRQENDPQKKKEKRKTTRI